MCGIAGRLELRPGAPVTADVIRRMCRTLRHRGPDDEGILLDNSLGMGMTRLSIIDLATGRQPVRNEDGSIWVVFNGEIYNFVELRRELEERGHRFYTASDTEVLVHLYEDHGDEFPRRLAGMFAIALWDRRRHRLLLARDRIGIKPLYYHAGSDRLVFGSEIKALLADGVDRAIDVQALHDYLSLGYVPGPRSIFRCIRKLPPGCLLTVEGDDVDVRPYWSLSYGTVRAPDSDEGCCEELRERLQTTVREHLRSDVPLGVFLSGGVDSGTLVALASEAAGRRLQTFSIGFEDPSFDELSGARAVARRYGTDHHELVLGTDAARMLPEVVRAFDEPFADSSALPVYCVSKLASGHVKVALSGEGGDEVFAGYQTYEAYRVAEIYKRLPRLLAATWIPRLVRSLPVSHRRVSFDYRAKRFVESALLPPFAAHYGWKVMFSEEAKRSLYAAAPRGVEDPVRLYRDAWDRCDSSEPVTRLQHIDLTTYLPDDLLVKADRMSMAHSLEVRVPYLDHRLVEWAASLPSTIKLRGFTLKYLLKRTMEDRLPRSVVYGRKRGFNVPIPSWLAGDLRDMTRDTLGAKRLRESGIFDARAVDAMLRDHETKRRDVSRNLWGLLVFALWHQEYAGGAPA